MGILYPAADVAIPEAQRLIGMLTGATPKNLTAALKSGWIVQGFVQGLTLGEPSAVEAASEVSPLAGFDADMSDADALVALQKLANEGPSAAGLLDGVGGRAALKLLLPVLQRWMVRWLEEGGLEDLIGKLSTGDDTDVLPEPA